MITTKHPKTIGERSEGLFLAKFLQKGWKVLLPFGNNHRYDFVIDRGSGFERIQVKTGRYKNGSILSNTCSSQSSKNKLTIKNYIGQIDYFGVYCPHLDKYYMIPIHICGLRQVTIRHEKVKHNQHKGVNWASDYEI